LDFREHLSADTLLIRSPLSIGDGADLYGYNAFSFDGAHQPDPFTVPYMLTGDPFYLDGLQMWSGIASLGAPAGPGPSARHGPYAVIYDGGQVRGEGWLLRTRVNAWNMSPDDDPMRAAFSDMLDDALAKWEGQRNIRGTKYETHQAWINEHQYYGVGDDIWSPPSGTPMLGPPPLHWWSDHGQPTAGNPSYNPDVAYWATHQWMYNFLIFALGHAVELGFDGANTLFEYAAENIIGQAADPDYNPALMTLYTSIFSRKGPDGKPAHLQTWKEAKTGWAPAYANGMEIAYWPGTGHEIYWDITRGALGIVASLPNGSLAWKRYNEMIAAKIKETGQAPNWTLDPTWAIIPRQ
jgi:hypothetical protein